MPNAKHTFITYTVILSPFCKVSFGVNRSAAVSLLILLQKKCMYDLISKQHFFYNNTPVKKY